MYYAIIFVSLFGFSLTSSRYKIDSHTLSIFYFLSFLMLFLTSGLRYETGGDWTSYTEIFNVLEPFDEYVAKTDTLVTGLPVEFGYKLLNSISKFVLDDVQFLFFIVASIISIILFRALLTYSPNPIVSVLVYFGTLFFAIDMIVIRQGIAIAIMFNAYKYIPRRDAKSYFISALIALMFHTSVLFLIPIYWIINKKYSTRALIISFIIFLIIYLFRIAWFVTFCETLMNLFRLDYISYKLALYLTTGAYATERGFSLGMVINCVLFMLLIYERKRLEQFKYFNLFFNLFICYLFVYFCLYELVEISSRLKYYFMISLVVLLPMWCVSGADRILRTVKCTLIGLFSLMYCKSQVFELPVAAAFNPYQNYIIHSITGSKSTGKERLEQSDKEYKNERKG